MRRPFATVAISVVLSSLAGCPADADPWPVKLDPNPWFDPNGVSTFELLDDTIISPLPNLLPDVRIRKLPPIEQRQRVKGTFGEPRGLAGRPPSAYLHTGTDISAPILRRKIPKTNLELSAISTMIFTITTSPASPVEDVSGKWPEYQSIRVGEYRYKHVAVDPVLAGLAADYARTPTPSGTPAQLILPAGTLIGRSLETNPRFDPHLHLERELGDNRRFYHDALERLRRYADDRPPDFPLPVRPITDPALDWMRQPVRLVRDFDSVGFSSDTTRNAIIPTPFPVIAAEGTPVVSRAVDILARVRDSINAPLTAAPGDFTGDNDNSAPVRVGFTIFRTDAARSFITTAVPTQFRIDLRQPLAFEASSTPPTTDAARPEPIASLPFFRRVYWVHDPLGTFNTGKNSVGQMDFIVTNARVRSTTEPARTDFWDTDVPATRNDRYLVEVRADDLSGRPEYGSIGNTAARTVPCVVCNRAFVDTIEDAGPAEGRVTGKVRPGQPVKLTGYNFYSPIGFPGELPVVALVQERDGRLQEVLRRPVVKPQSPSNNDASELEFAMPSAGELTTTTDTYVDVLPRCDPTRVVEPPRIDYLRDHRTLKKLVFASDEHEQPSFSLIWAQYDESTLRYRIMQGDTRGTTVLNPLAHIQDMDEIFLDVSDDGHRYVLATTPGSVGEGSVLEVYSVLTSERLMARVLPGGEITQEIRGNPSLDATGSRFAYRRITYPSDGTPRTSEIVISDVSTHASDRVLYSESISGEIGEAPMLSPAGDVVVFTEGTRVRRLSLLTPSQIEGFDVGFIYPLLLPLLHDGTAIVQNEFDQSIKILRPAGGLQSLPPPTRLDAGFVHFYGVSRDGTLGVAYMEEPGGAARLEVVRMTSPEYPVVRSIPGAVV